MQIGQLDTQREALRQQSVGAMIQAQGLESEIYERVARGDLAKAQADKILRLAQFDVPMALAEYNKILQETATSKASEQERQFQVRRGETLLPGEQSLQSAREEHERAGASAQGAAARLSDFKQKMVEYTDSVSGKTYQLPLSDLHSVITGEGRTLYRELIYEQRLAEANRRADAAEVKSTLERQKEASGIEVALLRGQLQGMPKPDKSMLVPETVAFAANSDATHMYVPTKFYNGKYTDYERVDLPIIPGDAQSEPNQLTARKVYLASKRAGYGTDLRRFLEDVVYRNKLKIDPPWKGK